MIESRILLLLFLDANLLIHSKENISSEEQKIPLDGSLQTNVSQQMSGKLKSPHNYMFLYPSFLTLSSVYFKLSINSVVAPGGL